MHLTLAARLDSDEKVRGFVKRVQRLEPGLFTLTAPSRLFAFDEEDGYAAAEGNHYCRPLRAVGSADGLRIHSLDRCRTVNLTRAVREVQTLEVRMHGGTTEFRKVALWLSLWMQVFNRSRYAWAGDGVTGSVLPAGNERIDTSRVEAREDIVKLLAAEEIDVSRPFVAGLRRRRRELRVRGHGRCHHARGRVGGRRVVRPGRAARRLPWVSAQAMLSQANSLVSLLVPTLR